LSWEKILKIDKRRGWKVKNLSPSLQEDIDYVVARIMGEPTLLEQIMKILTLEEEE
jgi:DNA-binding GntR family transcriptional regulator